MNTHLRALGRGRLTLALLILLACLAALRPPGAAHAAGVGAWSAAGSSGGDRFGATATTLLDGTVLLAGGTNGPTYLQSSALYNPTTNTWAPAGNLKVARRSQTATLLGNGKVLVVGGEGNGLPLASAELYDPATKAWTATKPLAIARSGHTATLLADGRVLVAGGGGTNNNPLTSAEIFDPATQKWTGTLGLAHARSGHTATLLTSGKVLVAGGSGATTLTELYNPAAGSWSPGPDLTYSREGHTATLLKNGKVLIAGGSDGINHSTAGLYSPLGGQNGTWTPIADMPESRGVHTATLLADGRVLLAGGYDTPSQSAKETAVLYDPSLGANGGWAEASSMSIMRVDHAAALLADGRVLVVGGGSGSAERFDPAPPAPTVPLILTAGAGGAASASPAGPQYPVGSVVTLTATPDAGQLFLGWTIDAQFAGWASLLTLTMNTGHTVVAAFAPRPSFPDATPGTPEGEAIAQLAARGVVLGYGDGRFGPGDTTQRAQMAALIARAMGWDAEDWGTPFADGDGIPPALWRNVGTLAHYGVAYGYGYGTYGPTDSVTKAQTISFITRAMVAKGYWVPQPDDPALYANVPAASGHRADIATYVHYCGAAPGTDPADPWADWSQPANRAWFARAEWQALNSYWGVDRTP